MPRGPCFTTFTGGNGTRISARFWMLYDIHRGEWDADICALLDIPMQMLPEVRDCAANFGVTDVLGAPVPILGVAGDQQAAR